MRYLKVSQGGILRFPTEVSRASQGGIARFPWSCFEGPMEISLGSQLSILRFPSEVYRGFPWKYLFLRVPGMYLVGTEYQGQKTGGVCQDV